jgi:hypothetical protein
MTPWALFLFQQAVGEDDLDDLLDGGLAGPVALQLDRERDPADRLAAGLDDPLETGPVGIPKVLTILTVETAFLTRRSRSIECTPASCEGW